MRSLSAWRLWPFIMVAIGPRRVGGVLGRALGWGGFGGRGGAGDGVGVTAGLGAVPWRVSIASGRALDGATGSHSSRLP